MTKNHPVLHISKPHGKPHKVNERSSFTLIELLIVIAIIGILASVVVLVLNPAQLLSQSRDSRRTQDLSNLNNAIGMYL
ncbi:MAG: type II secretion system GspH family protein, partial [Patescibacteria group bacterium]|nr:type II secretion system GspH family protein [Patescibacteria group bacterium]